jgi:aarF domain-containing kinase
LFEDIEIVLIDHGLYKELSEEFQYNYSSLWKGIVERDEKKVKEMATLLGSESSFELFSVMLTSRVYNK